MKNATTTFLTFISLSSFAQQTGSLIKKYSPTNLIPHISYVPAKSFNSLSYSGSDSVSFYAARVATVAGFYISQIEVTNKEYREFVVYIKDSMAHTFLKHFKKGGTQLDWSQKIDWTHPLLEPMMLSPDERIFARKEINTDNIRYDIDLYDERKVNSIYPDTLVWIKDFAYSYNEPLTKRYFSHPSFDNYPVLGISAEQAMAFCQWKKIQVNESLRKAGAAYEVSVRLPTNAEWESAASGEKDTLSLFAANHLYSINSGTITDKNGFMVKSYKDDGFFYTSPVKNFPAGAYGLYDMKGNVTEWTTTKAADIMNDEKAGQIKNYFIVKGGSWNSEPFYLQTGACQFYISSSANAWTGFRYVVEVIKKK